LILHSNRRQLKWKLSCNSPTFTSCGELIQNSESHQLEPLNYYRFGFPLQTVSIPNEIAAAKYFHFTEGKSEEEKIAELKKLLETPSGVILFSKLFITPKVTDGMKEVTYVIARLVSDGPARIDPTDAKKLIQSVDCQDLIKPHIYTVPYIYDESFEASRAE
ncbi:MAG: hypothetical protein L7U72_16440, partial [Rubripirellula sp.]|nr:hypothetical protein [Rubripirellula sp.]